MNHLDLFSGIGGFALAARWVWGEDHNVVAFCDNEPFAQKVLKKNWPDVPIIDDVRSLTHETIGRSTRVDVLTGGFPCQPFSVAGKQAGKEDDRDLWPEMFRIIKEIRPRFIVGENVAGFVRMELDRTISDLEDIGYTVQPVIIPACAVQAVHRRDRVWIIAADSNSERLTERWIERCSERGIGVLPNEQSRDTMGSDREGCSGKRVNTDSNSERLEKHVSTEVAKEQGFSERLCSENPRHHLKISESPVSGKHDGLPSGLDPDRAKRIKALGNAIVPQVAYEIFKAVKEVMI